MTKHPIGAQIKEAQRELSLRQTAYPGWVGRGKMRQGEADHHMDLQRSIIKSLEWLRDNEKEIRGYIEALNAAPELKGMRHLVLFFEDDASADEFTAAVLQAKPTMRAKKF